MDGLGGDEVSCGKADDLRLDYSQGYAVSYYNLDEIPLPDSPAPPRTASPPATTRPSSDTVDSFEVLEQTIFKQKRLQRTKKSTDMRLKVLLKRTFDLVCTIMDRENGFDDQAPAALEPHHSPVELELSPDRSGLICASLDLETYLAESSQLQLEIHLQVDDAQFDASLKCLDYDPQPVQLQPHKRCRSSDDDSDSDSDDDDSQATESGNKTTRYSVHIRRLSVEARSKKARCL